MIEIDRRRPPRRPRERAMSRPDRVALWAVLLCLLLLVVAATSAHA
jgi:4-hydroxybenzoate polyprenyltransferase